MNPYSLHMHIPWILFITKMLILPSSWKTKSSFSDSRLPYVPIFLRKATCIHKSWKLSYSLRPKKSEFLEMPGIEPGAFHMQSERSTTELHPLPILRKPCVPIYHWATSLGGGIKHDDPVFHLTTSPGGGRQPVSYKFINPDHWGGGGSCCFAPVARQVSICVVCCSATYSFNYNTNITIWILRPW